MRNKGRIIALVAVVAVLFATWFFVSRLPDPADSEASSTPSPEDALNEVELVPFGQNDIVKIVMETPEGKLSMDKREAIVEQRTQAEDGTVTATSAAITLWESKDLDVDTENVSAIAYSGGNLSTNRLVVENATAEDLKNFGFEPEWKVTFSTADNQSSTVVIGSVTQDGEGFYVMTPGNPAIYKAGGYTVEPLKSDRLRLRNRNVYHRTDTLPADITTVKIEREGALLLNAALGSDTYWHITEPVVIQGDIGAFSSIQGALAAVTATEHMDAASADLAKYGLDKPKYIFTYLVAGTEHVLEIGGKDPDQGYLYCRIDGGETVFTQDPAAFTFLDKPFVELIEKFLYLPTIYDTTHLTVTVDGRTDVMDFDVLSPKDNPDTKIPEVYVLNGEKLEGKDSISGIKRYFQGAIGVRADRVDFTAKPVYEPAKSVMTLVYTLRNREEKTMKVELIPTPDGYGYYGYRNGVYSGLIISRTQMDEDSMGIRAGYAEMNEKIAKDKEKAAAATPTPSPTPEASK